MPALIFTGSPLLPPYLLLTVGVLILLLSLAIYRYFHRRFRPQTSIHHLSLFLIAALTAKLSLAVITSLAVLFLLLPSPQVVSTNPPPGTFLHPSAKIEVTFSRPVNRRTLEKTLSPHHPGYWVFEAPLYATHLYRKLVFYPTQTYPPDTTFTLDLSGLQNFAQLSHPYQDQRTFTTAPLPQLVAIDPANNSQRIPIQAPLTFTFDRPNPEVLQLDYQLDPPASLSLSSDHTNSLYLLTPSVPLAQGTTYHLTLFATPLTWNLVDHSLSQRSSTQIATQITFTTAPPPGITRMIPQGKHHPVDSAISLSFSQPMDQASVIQHFSTAPHLDGRFHWFDPQTLTFTPTRLNTKTTYTITVGAGARTLAQGFLPETAVFSFTTTSPIRVSTLYPTHNWSAVSVTSPIKVTFDQPVHPGSIEGRFHLFPWLEGTAVWEDPFTLTFTPSQPLNYQTAYTVTLDPGITGPLGLASTATYTSTFTTQPTIVKLAIPPYLQRYSLSCEVAALKMALSGHGITIDEDTLLSLIGFDPTPRRGNTWGNPYLAFVGKVNGRQMIDGYGVYWPPIARAASVFSPAASFEYWSISDLTRQLTLGNPVIVWVYSSSGRPTSWFTPEGQEILAASGEHAVTVTGFIGPADNPTQIILNDPLVGEVYWPRSLFDHKWSTFNQSGVVVYPAKVSQT